MHQRRILSAVLLTLTAPLALADRVVPSERVETRLIVRNGVSGARVGTLAPGESAEYLGSVPDWYEVRLEDGTEGFVRKSWSRVVPDPAEPAAPRRGERTP